MSDKVKRRESNTWARIEDGLVVEIVTFDPTGHYHEQVIWARVPVFFEPYVDTNYTYRDVTGDDIPEVVPPSFDYFIGQILGEVKARRKVMQNLGTFVEGKIYETTRESRHDIKEFISDCVIVEEFETKPYTTKWKVKDGSFVTMTKDLAKQVAYEIITHISMCFNREEQIGILLKEAAEKKGASFESLTAVLIKEINKGWPVVIDVEDKSEYVPGQGYQPLVAIQATSEYVPAAPDAHQNEALVVETFNEDYEAGAIDADDEAAVAEKINSQRSEILIGDLADPEMIGTAFAIADDRQSTNVDQEEIDVVEEED